MMNTYFNWFKKLINILIELILFFAVVATLYVFTSVFSGMTKVILFVVLLVTYIGIIYLLKNKVKDILNKLIQRLSSININTLLLVIAVTMVLLKIVYGLLFYFDATTDGDIQIYINIADQIVKTRILRSDAISHLFGAAIHFALFKFVNMPIHIGMFIVFFIGTIINFISFSEIIGKEKSFLAVMLYILMPSSVLLTFCPTHEIFLYMYLSIFIFSLNRLIKNESKIKNIISVIFCTLSSILACLVNPSGYIAWIVVLLVIVLSNINNRKRILITFVLLLSILGSNLLTNSLDVNEHITTMNTYTILIHGSNPESLGEQVDGYPLYQIRMNIYDNNMDFSDASFEMAAKNVLLNQYEYLLTHPINLIELIAHKFYILWSGNHYSIEMAYVYGGIENVCYYIMLGLSALLYLLVLTIGLIYTGNKENSISITNYKLAILGCFTVTMLSIVTNKYSLYVTLFIYLVCFYKIDIDENN